MSAAAALARGEVGVKVMSLHRCIYNFAAIDSLRIVFMDVGLDYATKFLPICRRLLHTISTALSSYFSASPVVL